MESSPAFISSPTGCHAERRTKSKYTYRHLNQLSEYSTKTPLRVVAHVDLDAFYAQCEMVRLGTPADQPLAVQQWQGLIAINYPARAFGMGRHITTTEAKKICPNIILQHVATWKEGDAHWAYHEDSFTEMATHKVSLDPYRKESRKIFAVVKEALPAGSLQRVEKAGIDEMFLDLSAHVHKILLSRYPELAGNPPYDDPTELLPSPPSSVIEWATDGLVDLNNKETEEDCPDWDDICLSIAAEIVRDVRKTVFDKLHYTCSAGLACNKMIAKLGSAYKKPNGQSVVRNRAIEQFLGEFKFTKIRNLGGKLGDEVVAMFNTDKVKDLMEVPLEQLQKLGDDTGVWLYNTIRGQDTSDVNPRTQIKSMLSAKSFRPPINTFEQGVRWLRIFSADIFSRCVEEGVVENKRKPKTINLHHRQGGTMRSRSSAIPQGKILTEEILFNLAKNLLAQIIIDGRVWPCANLSLSLGGFEDQISGNMGIKSFFVPGSVNKRLHSDSGPETPVAHSSSDEEDEPDPKRARTDENDGAPAGIRRFFRENSSANEGSTTPVLAAVDDDIGEPPSAQGTSSGFFCGKCKKTVDDLEGEHTDWHFAKELASEMRREEQETNREPAPPARPQKVASRGRGRGRPSGSAIGKGQQRLQFGNG